MENIQLKETRKRVRDNIISNDDEDISVPSKLTKSPSRKSKIIIKKKPSGPSTVDIVIIVVVVMLILFVALGFYHDYYKEHPEARSTTTKESVEVLLSEFEASLSNRIRDVSSQYDSEVKLKLEAMLREINHLKHQSAESTKYYPRIDEISLNIQFALETLEKYDKVKNDHSDQLSQFTKTIDELNDKLAILKSNLDTSSHDFENVVRTAKAEVRGSLSNKYVTREEFDKFFSGSSNPSSCVTKEDLNNQLKDKFEQLQEGSAMKMVLSDFLEGLNQNKQFISLVHSLQNEIFSEDVQSLRQTIDQTVEKEYHRMVHQDIINRVDYAAATSGAKIEFQPPIRSRCGTNPADVLLQKSKNYFHEVGNRWCFQSSMEDNYIVIRLSENILPRAITLEFIDQNLDNAKIAPKHVEVFGKHVVGKDVKRDYYPLGSFEYRLDDKFYQTFDLTSNINQETSHIKIKFLSNHGDKDCTCLYRVRVHGDLVEKK